ncbi:MAG: S49 family peptidase [Zetaproteobacteria bacterium]|nr:MAG: S49 family peptidase [Zetaproteobacteria bacterium]
MQNEDPGVGSGYDRVREKYLKALSEHTGRNVIAYYSGWTEVGDNLQQVAPSMLLINDWDKHAFMAAIKGLDRARGLDLILHTPGGDIAATESLVDYLHDVFNRDVRAIVPQIAMSAGTMIACACKEIVLGRHSNLGPIDPQINGVPAQAVLDEFEEAIEQAKRNPESIPFWQAIIGKYHPTFLGECRRAIRWSRSIVRKWLRECMFAGDPDAQHKADKVVNALGDHSKTKTHSRHLSRHALPAELKVTPLESDDTFQDLVLSAHHAFLLSCAHKNILKIVENHQGRRKVVAVRAPAKAE